MPWTDRHYRMQQGLEIDGRIDLAALDGAAEIAAEHVQHPLHVLEAAPADRLVAHGFGANLGKQRRSVRLVDVPDMGHRPFDRRRR